MAEKCKECGCECARCAQNDQQHCDMHLHVEIENLRQRLLERDNHIVTMETHFLTEAEKFPNGELASMKEELLIWQEKYSRLHEAHKRVQKVNQNLEDKLLRIVDKCETEKGAFTKDIATLSHRLADANYTIHRLTQDNEKYRNDVNLAIQLLQCKPSNFVGQKYDSLPLEVQAKVRTYVAQKRRSSDVTPPDVKSITVPISTFPPTAMVYNITKPTTEKNSDDDTDDAKPPVDVVSAAIMAKVLEDREKERIFAKHCDTCTCHRSILMVDAETQTNILDASFYNECSTNCTQSIEKHTDNVSDIDNSCQGKDNHYSMTHTIYHEVNENALNNGKTQYYNSSNYRKSTNYQHVHTRDKFVARKGRNLESSKEDGCVNVSLRANLNKKNGAHRTDSQVQGIFQNQNETMNKQGTFQKANDCIGRIHSDKSKPARINKRYDFQSDNKCSTNNCNKLEKKSSYNRVISDDSKNFFVHKEQSHIDIVNDRLWKNEWAKLKSDVVPKDSKIKDKVNSDVEIDVINDRIWRNDRSVQERKASTQLTVIEVKSIDNTMTQNDSGQTEIATSPSFSSDSMVISTSDPSSSSSDVVHPISGAQLSHNVSNLKSSGQNRISGPRNCLVRVTPGSKNILLDNAGHYKTVLYTSGNSKPNTALVHTKKLSRSGSERSTSASSDDNSPVLVHDNNQLQRVAEWVQSSVCIENSTSSNYNKLQTADSTTKKKSSLMYINESQIKCKAVDRSIDLSGDNHEIKHEKSAPVSVDLREKNFDNDVNTLCLSGDVNYTDQEKEKDLITFDVPNEDDELLKNSNKVESADFNYEVNITKEMEETYLKLAASLDPVTLSLSTADNTDITIEKYRKDHRKLHLQRSQDKAGSKI
ncbi:hypothetical protein KM043_004468 [Ampulex compressa]|nr:hypothetical protein KM043_004468 [Ampulex compressa]